MLFKFDFENLQILGNSENIPNYIFKVFVLDDESFFSFEENFILNYWLPIKTI